MYRPDFPVRNYQHLQRSKIAIGDNRHFGWETTYSDAMRPRTVDRTRQSIDTASLQRSHWNPGDVPTATVSEMRDSYRGYGNIAKREAAGTRDQLMRTSFQLGDGAPMESRPKTRAVQTAAQPRRSLREQMVSTHFDLKNPAEHSSDWQSTNRNDFKAMDMKPSEGAHIELNKGLGAKSTFDQMGAFSTTQSCTQEAYQRHRPQTSIPRGRAVTVTGKSLNFEQGTTQKWQRTNFQVGDTEKRYSTTMGDGIRPPNGIVAVDPHYASMRRQQDSKSCLKQSNFPSVTESTAHAALKPHPECKVPPLAEKTAFKSHHDYRNWDARPSTTMGDAYGPKKVEHVAPINHKLQETHAKFGDPTINEKRTLYADTFTNPPQTQDKPNMQEIRNFHMAHHSNSRRGGQADRTEITTNQASYTGCKGGKASEMCDALRGGHNIVPNDERFNVKRSAMKDDYVEHKDVKLPQPVDNSLQKSHIQLQGNGVKWSTTQRDYFQFNTYKMPGGI